MFFQDSRKYIMKLIRIQRFLIRKGFRRADHKQVVEAISAIENQLQYFQYASDDKMRGFIDRNHDRIKTIIPGEDYPGYQKLMNEFINLQKQ